MKKAFQISLAGTLFTIEDDAYARLDEYLASVKKHFASVDGKDEIVRDIESRIAEKLLESDKVIISIAEVESVIASMGKVEDFGDGVAESAEEPRSPKKLYRNPDDRVVAGVSSGLAAYFGIDSLWIRLAFVILTFVLNGFPIFVYILLWIIIPEAKTAAQKLEMQGSPVTIETIGENIKEKMEEASRTQGARIRRILSTPFAILKAIVEFIRNAIIPILRVLLGLVLAAASLFGILALSFLAPYVLSSPERLADFPLFEVIPAASVYLTVIGGYFALAIPAIFVFILAIKLLNRKAAMKAGLGLGLVGVWILSLALAGGSAAVATAAYQDYIRTSPVYESITRTIPLEGSFESLYAAHGQKISIVQGEEISLVAKGREKDIERGRILVSDGTLTVTRKSDDDFCIFCDRRTPEYTLTVPSLSSISIEHGSRLEVESIEAPAIDIASRHGSRIEIESLEAADVSIRAEHGSRATVAGAVEQVSFQAAHGSRIDAENLVAKDARATAEHGSEIRTNAQTTLDAEAEHGSRIIYRGSPDVTERAEYGSSVSEYE